MKLKIAIAYDFDGTLAMGNIQENSFIPDLGMSKKEFWEEAHQLSKKHGMDEILAYMYLLIGKAREQQIRVDKKSLKQHGKSVKYFNGVEGYFKRINAYAKKNGASLEHYIISSGTKEMIEGTSIAKEFQYIYASSFKFDHNGLPEWPAQAVNYTTKTQFLFRINKGVKNLWEHKRINDYVPENERPIPFKNMIYIGDGLTDVPSMKLVKDQGGSSVAVYAPNTPQKTTVKTLLKENRANFVVPADYSQNKPLDELIKALIDGIVAKEKVAKYAKI